MRWGVAGSRCPGGHPAHYPSLLVDAQGWTNTTWVVGGMLQANIQMGGVQ